MTQNNPKLFVALIIVIGIAIGYFYYSQVLKLSEPTIPPSPISNQDDLKVFRDLSINFGLLDDPLYINLKVVGEMPVNPGFTGKKDIFTQ